MSVGALRVFRVTLVLFTLVFSQLGASDPAPTPAVPPSGAAATTTPPPAATPPVTGKAPTLSVSLVPKDVVDGRATQILVTVTASGAPGDAVLTIDAPPGFVVTPAEKELPSFERELLLQATLRAQDRNLPSGERVLGVHLHSKTDPTHDYAGQRVTFSFYTEIALGTYFILGVLGIVVGYILRLAIAALAAVSPPQLAPPPPGGAPPFGPITAWVKDHYYVVDGLVTVALGMLLLISLTKDGRPPQNGTAWYTALAVGVGIGLFTNSELLTKIKK